MAALAALVVCLGVSAAASAQFEGPLYVTAPPQVSFTAEPTPGTALGVSFTDTSTDDSGPVASWHWDFNDPDSVDPTSSEQDPEHTFTAPGSYEVSLTVTDIEGQSNTGTQTVVVKAPPDASFTWAATSTAREVQFTDTSEDSGELTYAWDFGDGSPTSSERSPKHPFAAAGSYQVVLTVTDVNGVRDSDTQTVVVKGPPVASFTASAGSGDAPLEISFTDASSDDGALTWQWDFGDGGASSAQSPKHTYTAAGTYDVVLTVTDVNGVSDAATRRITVNARPSASFTANSLTGPAPFEPTFTSTASDPDGSIASYAWDFGDGTTGSGATASHRYTAVGTYPVTLTVTDDDGARATSTETVTVTLPPEVIDESPATPTLQKVLTDLLERTPGPCSVRMLTASALVVCGGNKPSSLGLRISTVNAGAAPVAGTVSGVETIPAKGRRVRASAKSRRKARYPTVRRVAPAFGSTSFVLKPPKKLRRALKLTLKRRGRVARKPVVTLRAGGVTARMPHAVTARKKKTRR